MVYQRVSKPSSENSQIHKKDSPLTAPAMLVQAKSDSASPQEQEMPSYTPLAANWATNNNLMRSMSGSPVVQRQEESGEEEMEPIQAKLTIGQVGDKYEQEADETAQRVVNQINAPAPVQSSQGQSLQREDIPQEEEELQMKSESGILQREDIPQEEEELQMKSESGIIQREDMPQEEEELQMKPASGIIQREDIPQEEEELQMKSESGIIQREDIPQEEEELQMKPEIQRKSDSGGMAATPDLEASIQQAKGGGQSLADNIREPMEQAFGADFSGVNVHTDAKSDQLNQSIQAKAFTTGQDVFFRQGAYDPGSRGGQELLAHELTHVVQQNGRGQVQAKVEPKHETQSIHPVENSLSHTLGLNTTLQSEGVVQRETFMEQRKRRSNYDTEETVQRHDLVQAIMSKVNKVKPLYEKYKKAKSSPSVHEQWKTRKDWQEALKFLRKQEVVITDEGDFDPASLTGRLVEYDKDATSQGRTKITISGGQLNRSDGKPVDTKESVTFQKGLGWEIFVMSPAGEIHMASHKIGKYHHSSLLGGGNVAAAGMMQVESGSIKELNNHSGHYAPKEEHIRQVLRQLQKSGVSLNFNVEMGTFAGLAADYMKPISAGGKGGTETFERNTTQHVIKHFFNIKGAIAVKNAFTSSGWTYTTTTGGMFVVKKPDSTLPTHQEVRSLLTSVFGQEAAPNVTQES